MSRAATTAALAGVASAALALGQPAVSPWPVSGPDRTVAVAGAAVSGIVAAADTAQDSVEFRELRSGIIRTLSRSSIQAALPWMTLDTSDDGPVAVALSDSGRLAFIAMRDDPAAPDAQPGDAILRYEIETGDLRVFARVELGSSTLAPQPALAHFRGRLYLGSASETRAYSAFSNTVAGAVLATTPTGASAFAIDRDTGMLYAMDPAGSILRRAATGLSSITYSTLPSPGLANVLSITWSDHYGGPGQAGLYLSRGTSLAFIPAATARAGSGTWSTIIADAAVTLGSQIGAIAATAEGKLLCATPAAGDAIMLRDTSDTRLNFESWAADEFAQQVTFAKGLVSPNGEPAGWVIDADVQIGWTRFHPASPDAACWVVLLCLMNDEINGDPQAQPLVRTILQRYAGRAPDGIRPLRSADGIYWHWLDPITGGAKSGWGDGYATLSTMKIVLAAARAVQRWPNDPEIRASARDIICGISNWDAYFGASGSRPMFFLGQPGGGTLGGASNPFHEGIIFAEQAAAYGGTNSQSAWNFWKNRGNLPVAFSLTGKPVTTGAFNVFQSSFVSLYSLLTQGDLRSDPNWRQHYQNLRLSHAGWTDDNSPKYNTVFSAGTTRSDWGGYSADSLTSHPGDVTTFTSLLAMVAGDGNSGAHVPSAAAAYHAYRRGARQTFLTGASILYRRSQVDQTYQPNSAGLPDVTLGALGLAEFLQTGSVASVLIGPYPTCEFLALPPCPADWNSDGGIDPDDLGDYINCYFSTPPCDRADFNTDGSIDPDDLGDFLNVYFGPGC